jgi:hypothetical protein
MAKIRHQLSTQARNVFEDLEKFLEFCREYGYRYNPSDLYNFKSYAWQQYNKFINGKNAKNMWEEDTKRFAGRR